MKYSRHSLPALLVPAALLATFAAFPSAAALALHRLASAASVEAATAAAAAAELAAFEAQAARAWAADREDLEDQLLKLSAAAGAPPNAPLVPEKINLQPKTVADLAPALAMLKGLYEDSKDRIAKLNQHETEYKAAYDIKETEHKAKLVRIEARFANQTLSLEFRTNETRDEDRLWNYWFHVRERQHKQYRTGLKIQHATLEKTKSMIDMYEKTMSGAADKAEVQGRLRKLAPPEIVLLEATREDVRAFCRRGLEELRATSSPSPSAAPAAPAA